MDLVLNNLQVLICHKTQPTNQSIQTWSVPFDLSPFWIASKQIFLRDENNLYFQPIPNNPEFIFIKKISEK